MGQFWVIFELSLMGHWVTWVSECDLIEMLVEVIINEQIAVICVQLM